VIGVPIFSFFSFASAAESGACSTFGVSTASSSLPLAFRAGLALALVALAFVVGSEVGVLGVESFSLVAVFGVFAGYLLC
jgi:hypothetical protein